MAALGLTYGQFAIGTNIYTLFETFVSPVPLPVEFGAEVPDSTVFPVEVIGYSRGTASGTIIVTGTNLVSAQSDICGSNTERKLSWVQGGSEVYTYAKAGQQSIRTRVPNRGGASDYYLVDFTFQTTRSPLYLASDDSILWGG